MVIKEQPSYKLDMTSLKSIIGSLYNKYEFLLKELTNPPAYSAVELKQFKLGKVQEISLELANDFITLSHYKLENSTDYYTRIIDPVIASLRETRQAISLYFSAER